MRTYLAALLLGIVALLVIACGGAATAVPPTNTPAAAPTQAPTVAPPTEAPTATTAPEATEAPEQIEGDYSPELLAIAAERANGPGAIFVGDLSDLVGPAPTLEEGDADGIVPLWALEEHRFVYESDYYRSLLERAKFTNPTEMTYDGDPIIIQNACVNRAIVFCKIVDTFLVPRLTERTNGKLIIESTSFPELGVAGPDTLEQVREDTLDMVNVLGPYVAGDLPQLEIQYLFGLYTERSQQFEATVDMLPDIEQLLIDDTGGYPINVNWHNGDDIFLFTKEPLNMPADVEGMKTRAFGTSISDWIAGMGGDPQFLAFAEVYTALERGILEAGVTGGDAGHSQRWYEVINYINGPLTSWPSSHNVVNKTVWARIPTDLQEIWKEEAVKMELEALRLGAIQNELGLQKNIDAGLEYIEFGPEMRDLSDNAVITEVVPNWVDRVGGPDAPFVEVFNRAIAPIVGITIESDGAIVRTN
jgi:TRAP-type C4-dicarboxylate transport system substrate-binding protein